MSIDNYRSRLASPAVRIFAASGLLSLIAGGNSHAADLPAANPPAFAAAPASYWEGFYAGAHVGYAIGTSNYTDTKTGPGSQSIDDGDGLAGPSFGGLQAGANHVFPSGALIGAEANISFPNHLSPVQTQFSPAAGMYTVEDKVEMFGTLTGRAGYSIGNWMGYANAGFAFDRDLLTRTQLSGANPGAADTPLATRLGWTVGFGAEWALTQNWSAKAEFQFMDFSGSNVTFPAGAQHYNSDLTLETVQVGLNYRWGDRADQQTGGEALPTNPSNWNVHGQSTSIYQANLPFSAPYTGPQSLSPGYEARDTVSVDAFIGYRIADGTAIYFNPEIFQGFGLDGTFGLAGFPNGEAQKAGFLFPRYNTAKLYVRQTFGFGGEQETLEDGPMQLPEKVDVSRLTLTFGKMPVTDVFDNNAYSHDPRGSFMNWALMDAGAFDYAADQYGYTLGAAVELNQKNWALRAGYFLEPTKPNGNDYDAHLLTRGQYIGELEERYSIFSQPGKLRLTGWYSLAWAGSFADTLADPALLNAPGGPDIAATRKVRPEYGFIVNFEQAVTEDFGLFSRASWQDGQTEIMAFTDINESFSLGGVLKGTSWGRPDDKIGVAGVLNGISKEYRAFLAAGGLGILIGDGQLPQYGAEKIVEAYYLYSVSKSVSLTADYQFFDDPAYNPQRGPVSVAAGRLHVEF